MNPHAVRLGASALSLLLCCLIGAAASAQNASQCQRQGIEAARRGDPAQAAALLERCIELNPDFRNLDYLLYNLGDVYENRLFDFERAVKTYNRLIDQYPQSRWSQRGRVRLEQLVGRESEAEPLARLKAIRRNYRELGRERVVAEYRALIGQYPEFSQRDEALFGLAQEHELAALPEDDRNEYLQALELYRRLTVEHPASDLALAALKQAGDILIELRRFDEAAAEYGRLAALDPLKGPRIAAGLIQELGRQRLLLRLYHVALALILALPALLLLRTRWLKISGRTVRRALLEPGIVLAAAAAGEIALALLHKSGRYFALLTAIGLGLAAATFCNALYIESRPLSAIEKGLTMALGVVLVSALVFAAFYGFSLWDVTVMTLRERYYSSFGGG